MTVRRTRDNNNGKRNGNSVRLTAYVTPEQKKGWTEMIKQASLIDGIRNPDNGTYLGRIIDEHLRVDLASIRGYGKTHRRTPALSSK